VSIHELTKVCLNISDDISKLAWVIFCDLAWVFEGDDGEIDASHHKHVNLYGLSHGISMLMDNAGIQLQLTGMRIELASSENPRLTPLACSHKRLEQFQHLFTVAVNHGNLRLGTQSTVSKLAQSTHIYVLERVVCLCHAIWDAGALCAFATSVWLRSNAGMPNRATGHRFAVHSLPKRRKLGVQDRAWVSHPNSTTYGTDSEVRGSANLIPSG